MFEATPWMRFKEHMMFIENYRMIEEKTYAHFFIN